MTGMRRKGAAGAISLAALCFAVAGCGGTYSGISDHAAPPAAAFPATQDRTLAQILAAGGGESGLVVLPTGLVFDKGLDRYGFGVFTAGKRQVTNTKVALYFAHGPDGRARGPYPVRIESLATKSPFVSQTTGQDPQASKVVYVIDRAPFTADGEWRVLAMVKSGDSVKTTLVPSAVVGHFPGSRPGFPKSPANPPDVGEKAPVVHTPTAAEVGGELSKIDTRIPPDDMEEQDFADVVGRKPVVLLFATPQFCQSRVCGPVVDEEEQVKQEFDDRVAFIHVEIYNDNEPNKGVRPQVRAFHLPSEPWLFVIDRHGVIRTRIEGAWSIPELERAVKGVTRE